MVAPEWAVGATCHHPRDAAAVSGHVRVGMPRFSHSRMRLPEEPRLLAARAVGRPAPTLVTDPTVPIGARKTLPLEPPLGAILNEGKKR